MRLSKCYGIEDFRRLAREKLPAPLFHYMDGGAEDEVTLSHNQSAFSGLALQPLFLRDVSVVETSCDVLGQTIKWPVVLAPTGMSRLFHRDGELAVARAATNAGTMYSLSTLSTFSIEDVGAVSSGPKMFQIYLHKDRGLTREFIQRCKEAGYTSLCLTVDMVRAGNRERDLRTGMTMPPKFTWGSLFSFALHAEWSLQHLMSPPLELSNVVHRVAEGSTSAMSVIDYINGQIDSTVTWDDAAKIIEEWGGPFAIKGLLSPSDAVRAADAGASAVMISNHGGRQLDYSPAPIQCLPAFRDAVGERLELIVDGGVRRGTDVLKALALGASACSIGRPYLFGLAAGGEAGVARVLEQLKSEVERDLALLGCTSLDQIGPQHVMDLHRPEFADVTEGVEGAKPRYRFGHLKQL